MTTARSPLDCLLDFFPTGTAEGERHLLERAYVRNDEFADLLTPPPGSPRILVGKKGTGKSAIIQYASTVLSAVGIPYLLLRPMDLDFKEMPANAAVGTLTRTAYRAILGAVSSELGSQQGGLISANDRVLYEEAIKDGRKRRDLVGTAARLLPKIVKPLLQPVDLTNILPDTTSTAHELQSAIADNLRRSEGAFYLFLDDTDQVAAPSAPDQLNRIWAFLLATRELTQKVSVIRIVVTLREEVWRRLIRDKAGQRDQADHFMPLIRELAPTRAHLRAVIQRRLALAALAADVSDTVSLYAPFFAGDVAHMPQSEERRSWEDLIVLRARERPRDAVQMISALAKRAKARQSTRIEEKDFLNEMPEFSSQRVFLLAQEVEAECPQIREVMDSFAKLDFDYGSFKLTAEAVRAHLRTVPSMFSTTLFGRTLHPDNDEDTFQLWRFLFELGILNARVSDIAQKDGFRHILPQEDPGLVSKARWNAMQGIVWEINPAYRDFIILKQEDEARRIGLPSKRIHRKS